MLPGILRRLAVRPRRWVNFFASLTALATNLKQLSEITSPDGHVFVEYEDRFRDLAEIIAMEAHQIQEHLGIDSSPPEWVTCPRCGGEGWDPNEGFGARRRFHYGTKPCIACKGRKKVPR